jgi:hypothetical protein
MTNINDLISAADAYKVAASIERDQTVSYRVFGDSAKLTALRAGADITVSRFNAALEWFAGNWPVGHALPDALRRYHSTGNGNALTASQGEQTGDAA